MGSDSKNQISIINLSKISTEKERGTQEWEYLCKRVKEACENNGCFEVVYDKIPKQSRGEVFALIRQLFVLPKETKVDNSNPKPYHGYAAPNPLVPLYESFGFEVASNYHSLKGFTHQLFSFDPLAHDHLCKILSSTAKGVEELYHTISKLITDSYGLGEKMDSIMPWKTLVRVMKYKSPQPGEDNVGLFAHTDKLLCTLVCEDNVSGLQVQTKNGQWIPLSPSPNSFVFVVADPLMAWSNGRLHAVRRRVIMSGEKDRYSFAAFQLPIEGTIIKPQKELVDENHPQILKEFDFMDFLTFSSSKEGMAMDSANQIFAFAGI